MPKTLLLADDSVTIQKVVGISFANEDVQIVTVDNGDDAVTRAREIRPDIVLADVVMPGKSGYDVCAALKADAALAHIPVLLLTGTFETFDEDRAARVGADGHITKPFEAQALVELVTARLSSAAAPRAAAPSAPAAAAPAEAEPFDFLEPEADAPSAVRPSGTARPAPGDSEDAFAFDAEPLAAVALDHEDDEIDLGNEATAARTTLLLDDEEFARAATAPPASRSGGTAPPVARSGGTAQPVGGASGTSSGRTTAVDFGEGDGDGDELTRLVLHERVDQDAPATDPLAAMDSGLSDPFAASGERRQWDVASDELGDPFPNELLEDPAMPEAAPSATDEDEAPSFAAPLFDDDAATEFELTELMPHAEAPAPAAAAASHALPAATAEPSDAMREQIHGTIEKIAWEALGDVSERIVREAVARIEQVAWDVIPRLAETLIREEIRKLKGEG
jgi:CheY-like chemotaxis protein